MIQWQQGEEGFTTAVLHGVYGAITEGVTGRWKVEIIRVSDGATISAMETDNLDAARTSGGWLIKEASRATAVGSLA